MLREPRELLIRELLPLNPPEPPPKPPDREALPEEKSRLPMLLELRLPPLRLAELALGEADREAPADRLLALGLAPVPRVCADAPARLPAPDWPRPDPENLSAVDLLE
jgi:hypothetical protein